MLVTNVRSSTEMFGQRNNMGFTKKIVAASIRAYYYYYYEWWWWWWWWKSGRWLYVVYLVLSQVSTSLKKQSSPPHHYNNNNSMVVWKTRQNYYYLAGPALRNFAIHQRKPLTGNTTDSLWRQNSIAVSTFSSNAPLLASSRSYRKYSSYDS